MFPIERLYLVHCILIKLVAFSIQFIIQSREVRSFARETKSIRRRTNQSFFARTSLIRHIVLNKRNTKAINKWQGKEIKPHFSHILFLFIALKGQSGIYHRRKHENTSDIWTTGSLKWLNVTRKSNLNIEREVLMIFVNH